LGLARFVLAGDIMKIRAFGALALAVTLSACGSSTPAAATSTTQNLTTDTFTGIVPAAVNGVAQSDSKTFTVGQGGGAVTVTLTSAVETYPGGTTNAAVVMGMAVGTPSGSSCVLAAGVAPASFQAGASATLSGTVAAATYCVLVTDQTIQTGPVAYTVIVIHP
jgi:hypothetical protein